MDGVADTAGGGDGNLHIMMFPFFAFGHVSPFVQLTRKIVAATPTGAVRMTFLTSPGIAKRIAPLIPPSSSVSVLQLSLPHVDGLPPGADCTSDMSADMAELLKEALDLTKPQVHHLLSTLKPHVVMHDFAQQWLPSIAHPLGIKTLIFSVFVAAANAYLIVPSRHPDELKMPPAGFPADSTIKSVPTYQANDFAYIFKSFDGMPSVYDRSIDCWKNSSAVAIKSCMEMEGPYINYLSSQYQKPVILAGPIVPEPTAGELDEKFNKWLSSFDENSVIYCSFGSETFLSDVGTRELLLGLEATEMPFLVVLNFPPPADGETPEEVMKRKIPVGFLERVKNRGTVHTGWVQQQLILCHKSVGCYLCHAGLSSMIEGVLAGNQLVMMPQKGDQYLNAALFAGDLGLGAVVERNDEDGTFTAAAVCSAVRKVMAVDEEKRWRVRENHEKWREFFMNEKVQEKYIIEFVERLSSLVFS